MANPHGTPIWYELLTDDAAASTAFYKHVIDWKVRAADPGGMDYRMIDAGESDFVGGLMQLTPEMTSNGAKATWLFYIGVDDVDATAAKVVEKGGTIRMAPMTMEGVGRMAMVADPQGVPFYIMRGASDESSTAFDRMGMGKCNWNELNTSDQAAANAFYADLFGWTYPDKMTMPGDMGDYMFIAAAGQTIGATMNNPPGSPPPAWQFYFRTPDIDATAARVMASGGTVHYGPAEVPGGDRIIVASDSRNVMFGAVGPGEPGGA